MPRDVIVVTVTQVYPTSYYPTANICSDSLTVTRDIHIRIKGDDARIYGGDTLLAGPATYSADNGDLPSGLTSS